MLRRRGPPARASVLRAAQLIRANKRAPRGIDLEQMHRRPADRAAVRLRPHGSWSAAVARWNAGRLVCIPDRGSALPASGNSGGTAGEACATPRLRALAVRARRTLGWPRPGAWRRARDARHGRHGLRRDITAAGAAGRPGAAPLPSRTDAGKLLLATVLDLHFAALIPIPATESCTVSSSRSASHASAGYPQSRLRTRAPYHHFWVHLVRLGPCAVHDHACATGGQRGGAERRRCPV